MIDDKRYWFLSYGIEGEQEGNTVTRTDTDFFPLRKLTNSLTKRVGRKVVVRNFIEVSKETYLEFQDE